MGLLRFAPGPAAEAIALHVAGGLIVKAAADPVNVVNLAGTLQATKDGWALLGVPNALVRGVFDALDETGAELPPSHGDSKLNAHITVLRPDELKLIGGADMLQERGRQFRYTIGRVVEIDQPSGWPEMAKVWALKVHSPELQRLRRSYALSSLPDEGKKDFHITVAVRRRSVLRENDKAVRR